MKRLTTKMPLLILIASFAIIGFSHPSFAGPTDKAYFEQFLYQKENTSDDPDFPTYQYRFLMSQWNYKFQRPDGKWVGPDLSLFLYADGTYLAIYKENYFDQPDSMQFMPGPCQKIYGKWNVPDKILMINDFAEGDKAFIDNKNAMTITFTKNLTSEGLQGKKINFTHGFANYGPDEAFCF